MREAFVCVAEFVREAREVFVYNAKRRRCRREIAASSVEVSRHVIQKSMIMS
jgi:hypothetical protein